MGVSHAPTFVQGEGPVPSLGMIIGEAPGRMEEQQGRPFVGPSGELLDKALDEAGWSRDMVYITNVYKIRPPQNRTPTREEIADHKLHLLDELQTVLPQFVLLLGNVAAQEFLGETYRGTRDRGHWVFRLVEGERYWFLPTFHPAYVLRKGGDSLAAGEFFDDIVRFVDALRGTDTPG